MTERWLHLRYRYQADGDVFRRDVRADRIGLEVAVERTPGNPEIVEAWVSTDRWDRWNALEGSLGR